MRTLLNSLLICVCSWMIHLTMMACGDTTQTRQKTPPANAQSSESLDPIKNSSGSRLKIRRTTWSADGGFIYHAGEAVYDSLLDIDCTPKQYQGLSVCLPYTYNVFTYLYFQDVECTQSVIGIPSATTARFVSTFQTSGNPSNTWRIHELGQEISLDAVYVKSGEVCLDMTESYLNSYRFYQLGSAYDASQFASILVHSEIY